MASNVADPSQDQAFLEDLERAARALREAWVIVEDARARHELSGAVERALNYFRNPIPPATLEVAEPSRLAIAAQLLATYIPGSFDILNDPQRREVGLAACRNALKWADLLIRADGETP